MDQGALAKWEQGKREPAGAFLIRVKRFLEDVQLRAHGARVNNDSGSWAALVRGSDRRFGG